jgi:Leucine-rich repeat (LRR) protein
MTLLALFLAILVNFAIATNFPCKYYDGPGGYYCQLPYDGAIISVTTENEAITVSGIHNPGKTNDDLKLFAVTTPNVMNFVPTKISESFKNIQTFQLNDVKLTTLTTNAFTNCMNLEIIFIVDNNFPVLPASFAEACVNLKELHFYQNWIQTVDKNAFKGLVNLKILQLSKNSFVSLDPLTLTHTPHLQSIEAQFNELTSIHPDLFSAQTELTLLNFYQNKIEVLSALNFGSIEPLMIFSLEMNKINAIEPAFFNGFPGKPTPISVMLVGNICTNDAFNFMSITDVSIDPRLQNCFANWNLIPKTTTTTTTTTLAPKPPSQCSSGSCKLGRYFLDHKNIYSCVLENVDLALTSIGGEHETINGKLFNDADVEAVYFENSFISRVPEIIFTKFRNTKFLSIVDAHMTIIDDNTFTSCGILKRLDLSRNHIQEITETSLMKCQQLMTIDLTGNPVIDLESSLFVHDPNLKHVILNRKSYDEIPQNPAI